MTETARLRLPEIAAAQAQKHVTHNEALVALDTLIQISVLDKDLTAPPMGPAEGDCYIVAATATGDWTGWEDRIARYEDGAWRSYLPGAGSGIGWLAYVQDEGALYVLTGSGWQAFVGAGLGTAAYEDIGTSGSTVPLLDSACTVSAGWTFNVGASVPINVQWTDDGAVTGPIVHLDRASASPAASDNVGAMRFAGRDSGGNYTNYGELIGRIVDPTDGSEDGRFAIRTTIAGTLGYRLYIGDGVYTPGATGGDKGADTINAGAVYDDNSLLTCPALSEEFERTGTIDTARYDAMVPDTVIPEQTYEEPEFEEIEQDVVAHRAEPDGRLTRVVDRREVKAQKIDCIPVYDEAGNGIDMIERPVMRTVTVPERRIPRRHEVAHLFKRMLDDGFDPRDPEQYIARLKADRALPGMPTESEWQHGKLSLGELMSRKWLALEMLALVVVNHEERIAALERTAGNPPAG